MSHLSDHNSTDYQHGSKGVEVFVGGLARSLTEDKVHKVFSACGEIMDMRLIKDQKGILKLEGKKIGVLPSAAQDTLFIGNLNKVWSTDDFNKVVRQVFPDVVSIDLAQPISGTERVKKFKNRGFGFVKFSSHSAAARACRVGSRPDFVGGTLHPSVKWAEEDAGIDPDELAKIKIAFIRNLPSSTDENYLNLLFAPFGKIEKIVLHNKGITSVGFVHFAERSHLDNAIEGLNEKMVKELKGGQPFRLQVEVARPMDKKRKRTHEDPQNNQPHEILNKFRPQNHYYNSYNGHEDTLQKEHVVADPHEAAVLMLPVAVRERLLRILRLGIATRYDIEVESLTNLAELPESNAILVLDQFMLSGSDQHDKAAYLASLILKYQVDKLGLRLRDPVGLSSRVHHPTIDLHVDPTVPSYTSRYSSLCPDYRLPNNTRTEERSPLHLPELPGSSSTANIIPYSRYASNSHIPAAYSSMEEMSPNPSHQINPLGPTSYPKPAQDPYPIPPPPSLAFANGGSDPPHQSAPSLSGDRQTTRPQMRFDPFTGQPYKFDPFTGEPIVQENLPTRTNYEYHLR